MCGRFSQLPIHLQAKIVAALQAMNEDLPDQMAEIRPRYNLAPTQAAAVLRDGDAGVVLDELRWGLLPFWAKEKKLSYQTINARAETVAIKPAFRDAFKRRRAVVPMAGYFEWTAVGKIKQPWFLRRPDGEPLWAAALWEPHHALQQPDDAGTFTVITTTARDQAGDVHDRMPVFLPLAMAETWMRETTEEAEKLIDYFEVPPLDIRPVSRRVNAPKDDDPALLDRIPDAEVIA